MFQDISLSKDLNDSFKTHIAASTPLQGVIFLRNLCYSNQLCYVYKNKFYCQFCLFCSWLFYSSTKHEILAFSTMSFILSAQRSEYDVMTTHIIYFVMLYILAYSLYKVKVDSQHFIICSIVVVSLFGFITSRRYVHEVT